MSNPRRLAILGSTGSIGVSTLDVVARHPDRFQIVALSAHRQVDALVRQCAAFKPRYAVIGSAADAKILAAKVNQAGLAVEVLHGEQALETIASLPEVDTVMAAIVGIAGLRASYAAVSAGKRVLLANKEALVTAGPVFMAAVQANGATLLPIDSEHNAVFQALPRSFAGDLTASGVRKIVLTASGGPFRDLPLDRLHNVTPDQACAHPNWVMGRKISVDSATMMNKGLEVIEASWLFNAEESRIKVVIHPESVIHSLVEYVDGSLLAQLGNPDMRTPIAYALGFPDRIEAGVESLDLAALSRLNFSEPDVARFPCLELARVALRQGASAPTVLNAANEVAVAAFLASQLGFNKISELIEHALANVPLTPLNTIEDVFAADRAARECSQAFLARKPSTIASRPIQVSV
ncbi:MAG: 1-deoxy-D-xylulose 5-phosphate reductoisomerase [Betaproteobacteria bacterium]|nr:1-deoxy-D-xylulose 5-phosphate reductoisomerase [Betaproteobacteria bacterium]